MFRTRRISGHRDAIMRSGGLPATMQPIRGPQFQPSTLIAEYIVIVLVFKSTECPVCPLLLDRLSFLAGKPFSEDLQIPGPPTKFLDPFLGALTVLPSLSFQQASRLVLFTDATYIVLCPGDAEKLRGIAENAGTTWTEYPFVADSSDLSIIMKLITDENMRLDRGQAIPAILEYDGSNHFVDFGRSPGRYGDVQLLQLLFRHRSQIEANTEHTLLHATHLLDKTFGIHNRLTVSSNRHNNLSLPIEILEQIIEHIPPEEIDMQWAKVSITWYLATLSVTRTRLRKTIKETNEMLCSLEGESVVLDCDSGQYPPGTEIRWIPIKLIEQRRKEVMRWCGVLCRIVGFKP